MFLAMFDLIRFCFRILCVQSYELKMEYPRISCFFFAIYLEVWKEMRIFAVRLYYKKEDETKTVIDDLCLSTLHRLKG